MDTVTATFAIPFRISQGLASGLYERVGGVIRESGTKKVVSWLRDAGPGVTSSSGTVLLPLQGMLGVSAAASVLNLGISVMGFAVVMHRLKGLEQRLKDTQELLSQLDRKVDLGFYANFRAALDLADNAFMMIQADNRRSMAHQAINRFIEAQHVYIGRFDSELELGSQIANEYLLTLALAYIAEVRRYIELEEFDNAIRRFQQGKAILHDRTQKYVELLLTSNPAVYLHPDFEEQIDFERVTRIYQWIDPSLTKNEVFDRLRTGFFWWRTDRDKWVESLPSAIVSQKKKIKGKWRHLNKTDRGQEAFRRLPSIFDVIESTVETYQRFEAYQAELKAIMQLGMTFREWETLSPGESEALDESKNLIYIVPDYSEL